MWQRFTERARRVVFFAQEEAGRLGENYVSTEHLLLGLLREKDNIAARLLERMNISLARVQAEVERHVAKGDGQLTGEMQLTPRAKRVIDLAYDDARRLNNNYIGTEHLLLGLIREGEGLAGRVLADAGATLEKTREQVVILQASQPKDPEDSGYSSAGQLDSIVAGLRRTVQALPELMQTSATEFARMLRGEGAAGAEAETEINTEPGNLGVLKAAEGRKAVEVSADAAAYGELRRVFEAKDKHGYRELLEVGETLRVFLVKGGTRAKLLSVPDGERATGRYVRVLSGEYEGRAGWVMPEAWKQTGPDDAPFPPEN